MHHKYPPQEMPQEPPSGALSSDILHSIHRGKPHGTKIPLPGGRYTPARRHPARSALLPSPPPPAETLPRFRRGMGGFRAVPFLKGSWYSTIDDRASEAEQIFAVKLFGIGGGYGDGTGAVPWKTADLETILFNMHHLINTYRPHRARKTLCLRMEEQLERTRRETEENRKAVAKVEDVLAGLELVTKRADAICGGDGLGAEKEKKVDDGVAKARVRDMEVRKALVCMGG
ncbi:unnamed protein product [Tuber melanosporum]|uniref:Mediator of RNA polymerase II transcription subunit 7 n=1 Tax=Tuber melanosporum (strain Mel28) TaxID=656061 RepID=D5G578_TUBMM|nr:uncharacterized protein GSTUM_00000345001 [Tuber melanosporum]CAZ79671.1 unnamed protein product [Tuber melanosporum]